MFFKISYYQRWENEKARGVALAGTYEDDAVEYLLIDAPPIEKVTFREGVLSGITLLTTPEYCDLAYKDGNIDVEAMLDLQEIVAHKDNAVVFDVGGFVGANALVYAKLAGKNGRIVVFEPNPYNRNRIFRNLSHNPELQARVWVEPFALSDEKGTCEMVLSSNIDSGYSSTSRISHAHAKIADDRLPDGFVKHLVSVTTLDDYVKEAHVVPEIVKVDVEGAEYMLLQGAQNLLRETRPVFYVEYHSEYCATMCTQLLYLNGYVVYPCKEEEDNRLIIKAQFTAETSSRGDGSDSGAKWNEAAQLEYAAGRALERKEAERLVALCEDLTREKERALEQSEQLQREIHRLTDELDQVRNSTSWKITALPRKMMDSMKKMIRKR
ncbi:MAG: FkbM family methyltransferase [Clostridiaceae bacterium]